MKRTLASLLIFFMFFAVHSASAAPFNWRAKRESDRLAYQAKILLQKKQYDKALKKYRRADDVFASPMFKLEIAKLLIREGDLVQARDLLRGASGERARHFLELKAIKNSKTKLVEVEQKCPNVSISIFDPSAREATITIEGEEHEIDEPIWLNPGKYEIASKAPGYEKWTKEVTLAEGDHSNVEIDMVSDLEAGKKADADGDGDEVEDSGGGLGYAPALIAWGTSAAAFAVGIGFGIVAIQSTQDLLGECDGFECPPEKQDELDAALLEGNVSNVGFIVGGVALAAGTVFFVIANGQDSDDSDSGESEDDSSDDDDSALFNLKAEPVIGPTFLGVRGTF